MNEVAFWLLRSVRAVNTEVHGSNPMFLIFLLLGALAAGWRVLAWLRPGDEAGAAERRGNCGAHPGGQYRWDAQEEAPRR